MKTNTTLKLGRNSLLSTALTGALAALIAIAPTAPAWAVISNSVTVNGLDPQGGAVSDTATEEVDVIDAAPLLLISTAPALTTDGDGDTLGDTGDIVTYTYTITNSGNMTMSNVAITDVHDGSGALSSIGFASWTSQASSPTATVGATSITMAPGAVAVFTATYTITQTDVYGGGGTGVGATVDNDIDSSATVAGIHGTTGGGTTSHTSPTPALAAVNLDSTPSLQVAKLADQDTNVAAGTTITYTYTVTNDGSVPISTVTLTDTHKGVVDALTPVFSSFTTNNGDGGGTNFSANTGNTIDIIYPGDVAVFTATYVVTQNDVDTLQ